MKKISLLSLFLLFGASLLAQHISDSISSAGHLDISFGNSGTNIIQTDNAYIYLDASLPGNNSAALAKGNKVFVAANYIDKKNLSKRLFALIKIDENGIPDKSFGNNGIDTIPFNSDGYDLSSIICLCCTIQPEDGKIILAGGIAKNDYPYSSVLFCRINPDGNIDSGFGENGWSVLDFDDVPVINSLTVQKDHKIVAAGTGYTGNQNQTTNFFVTRLNPDGSVDNGFGDKGYTTTLINVSSNQTALALQNDGKIIVAGNTFSGGARYHAAIARYTADGHLDESFGSNGITTTDIDTHTNLSDTYYGVALQADGKILACGQTGLYAIKLTDEKMALVRYDQNGAIDYSFADSGRAIFGFDTVASRATGGVLVQDNGKIIISGYTLNTDKITHAENSADFAVLRYNKEGLLDKEFGNAGTVKTDIGGLEQGYASLLQPDGKFILVGNHTPYDNSNYTISLARYLGDPTHPLITKIKKWIQHHILHFQNPGEDENTAYYVVEESNNQSYGFVPVAKINAGQRDYDCPISSSQTSSYYRIKTVNKDNSFIYTQPIEATSDDAATISISPNPAASTIHISGLSADTKYEVRILNKEGIAVNTTSYHLSSLNSTINISSLMPGIYFLQVKDSEGNNKSLRFVKE